MDFDEWWESPSLEPWGELTDMQKLEAAWNASRQALIEDLLKMDGYGGRFRDYFEGVRDEQD